MTYLRLNFLPLLTIVFFLFHNPLQAVNCASSEVNNLNEISIEQIQSMDRKSIESAIGRKLKFKERCALKIMKKKLKKINKSSSSAQENVTRKIEGLGLAGFILGVVGLFFAPFLFSTLAVVFGFLSLNRIKRNPEAYTAKGLSIAAIVLGFVGLIGGLIVTLAM